MAGYELNLRDYYRILRKRRVLIITTILLSIAVSTGYIAMQPVVYEASATVKIMERQSIAGILTEWIVYTPADVMESQTKIIKGFSIMKKTAFRLGMINNSATDSEVNNIVAKLQASIRAEAIAKTNVIQITASASGAKEAFNLANTVAGVYVDENLLEKKRQASTARQFIEEQLIQLEERLRNGEEKLREFGEETKNVMLAEPLQKKLIDLEFAIASLLQRYTEKHPQVMRLKDEKEKLEEQLKGFSGQELEYARILREIEVNKKLFAMLKEKLEEARITEAQKVGDVSVLNPAMMPEAPISPQKTTGILFGGMAGILLGLAFAFMRETMDTSFGTIEDVEKLIQAPVLGIIPSAEHELREWRQNKKKFGKAIFHRQKTEQEEAYIRQIVHYKPTSVIAEAYRNIRTNLQLGEQQKTILITSASPGEGKSTILINLGLTFAQRGAKTLLVSTDLRRPCLAKTFGVSREPGLSELVAGAVRIDDVLKDVSDIMLGEMNLDEVVKSHGIWNIWLLPSGRPPVNPAEILESASLRELMITLRKRFDVILLDSPPVLPVTDPSLLVPMADSVILCHEIGKTARESLLRAKTQLESVGAKIAGVVLNNITPHFETLEPYLYYRYGYQYILPEGKPGTEAKLKKK